MRIEVTRGPLVESIHRVCWVVADARGDTAESGLDAECWMPDAGVFLRSAAKPFQAIAVIAGGATQAYGLTEPEVALLGGSHHGEAVHVDAVRSILAKGGLDEGLLQCGAHPPYNAAAREALEAAGRKPLPIHNNCSGKHAGLLLLAKHLGAPLESYMEPGHPVEAAVLRCLGAFTDCYHGAIPCGTDGCGLPAPAVTLREAAMAFARFATSASLPPEYAAAAHTLREAQSRHPVMVNGAKGFNTHLLQAAPHLVAKSGAEGVFCVGNTATGQGVAIKVPDGNNRGIAVATVALLHQLRWLDEDAWTALSPYHETDVLNVAGRRVGAIRPTGA